MPKTPLLALLSLTSLAAIAPVAIGQSVLVVDKAGGTGSHHTTIGAAVAVAQDGDLVLVRAGDYGETVVVDGIALRIQADENAKVFVAELHVTNLAANQDVTIAGIGVLAFVDPDPQFSLANNLGNVWIELDEDRASNVGVFGRIVDCADVVLRGCEFGSNFFPRCVTSTSNCYPAALEIERSRVSLFDCRLDGFRGQDCTFFEDGAPGILATDSELWVYSSTVAGGSGSSDCGGASFPGDGGAGIEMQGASELDRLDSTTQGGRGGTGLFGSGANGPGVRSNGGIVRSHGNRGRILAFPPVARTGATSTVDYQGKPFDVVFLLIASQPSPLSYAPGVIGPLVVSPSALVVRVGKAGAGGKLSMGLSVPPTLNGARSYFLQAAALNHADSEIVMGAPSQLHVLAPGL